MKNERTRYINIRFISRTPLNEKDAWFTVSFEVKRLFGVLGASDAGLFLSYYDEKKQGGIFRCAHLYTQRLRAALCFIRRQHHAPLFVYAENTSGTLRKAKEQLHNPQHLIQYEQNRTTIYQYWKTTFSDDTTTNG